METPEQRIQRVVREEVAIAPYDPEWPELFRRERKHLLSCLPNDLIRRVEHFGSTAVPGLSAKPIVDMLVEVADMEATKVRIAPVLESQGYDYFWRPMHRDDGPPFYAWFIKRNPRTGARTHHIHMVEHDFAGHWDRLLFRDYLIERPTVARVRASQGPACVRLVGGPRGVHAGKDGVHRQSYGASETVLWREVTTARRNAVRVLHLSAWTIRSLQRLLLAWTLVWARSDRRRRL